MVWWILCILSSNDSIEAMLNLDVIPGDIPENIIVGVMNSMHMYLIIQAMLNLDVIDPENIIIGVMNSMYMYLIIQAMLNLDVIDPESIIV